MSYYLKCFRNMPLTVKRFRDISAEPLFACQKRNLGILCKFISRKETVCRKWSRKNTIKFLMIILPVFIMLILTGGICISVNEQRDVSPQEKEYVNNFNLDEINKKDLFVVNVKYPLANNYVPDLSDYMGIKCENKIINALDLMIKSAEKEGYHLEIFNGFIDKKETKRIYDQKVNQLISEGYSTVRAEAAVEKLVPSPGKSEYETGFLIDIKAKNKSKEDFMLSDEFKWLTNHCIDYGFVLRYPFGKEDKTGKNLNPFAFRFVGVKHAKKMRSLSMCLDEYARYLKI